MKQDMRARVGRRTAGIATALLTTGGGLALAVGGTASPVRAVDGNVSGVVFQDLNFNGVRDGASPGHMAEPGVGGVDVTAVDADGTPLGTATTNDAGVYELSAITGAVSADVRVTFEVPAGYLPGATGSDSGSTVQFVTIPDGVANLAVTRVGQFNADDDPFVVLPSERTPVTSPDPTTTFPGLPALQGFPYSQTGRPGDPAAPAQPAAPTVLATQGDIGSTWGTATYGTSTAFSAAFVRTGAPLGAGGTGAIYSTDIAQATAGDPNGTVWVTIPNAGDTGRSSDTFPSAYDFGFDVQAMTSTLRTGLGDIDVTSDQTKLYAVNLNDRQLYEVQLSPGANAGDAPVPGTITAIPLPLDLPNAAQGCDADDVRPFGLGEHLGVLYVTLTCTAESTQQASNLRGYVYAMTEDAAHDFSDAPVIEVALDYTRGSAATFENAPAAWTPWTNDGVGFPSEPILSTISFDLQGNASVSIKDRQADKNGDDYAAGELLKFCQGPAGLELENDGSCGAVAGSQQGVGYGPGGGLFYDSSYVFDAGYAHDHTLLGSALQIPGFSNVLTTSLSPQTPGNAAGTSAYTQGKTQDGVRTLSLADGSIQNWATIEYVDQSTQNPHMGTFGKAGGIGDLSALLALAPVEIGNRVWIDTDGDGIQDAGEAPVAGVTVNLYADGGSTPIATAITDALGNYSFSNRKDVPADASANKWGLLIDAATPYDVRVDNPADYTAGPLAGYEPTVTNAPGPNAAVLDSNGAATVVSTPGGPVTVSVDNGASTPVAGAADHSFDFGFVPSAYDLMITKSLTSSAPYSPGSAVTYSLVVKNNGPAVARTGLTVTDRLPAGLSFASPAASGTDWTCGVPFPADTVMCTWNGPDLAIGDTTTAIAVNATVNAGVADGTVLVNYSVVRPSPQQPGPETIPVGTTNDGFENGSNVPSAGNPSNNDDSQPISVTVTPPPSTAPPSTTTPDTTVPGSTTPPTTPPTTTPGTVQPPEVLPPVPAVPSVPTVTPELPVTGGNTNGLLYAALALVLLGAGGYLFARRPRRRA